MTFRSSGALPSDEDGSSSGGERAVVVRVELGELYREHSRGLVRHLSLRTGCTETAHDLAQEAFLRLAQLNSAQTSRIRQPAAYLKRISTNLLRDWARWPSRRETAPETLTDLVLGEVDGIALLEARDTLRRLELAMARLKPKTRQVFLARRLDGLSYAEIADLTGLSVKGVEKQMSKAIANLDRLLDRA